MLYVWRIQISRGDVRVIVVMTSKLTAVNALILTGDLFLLLSVCVAGGLRNGEYLVWIHPELILHFTHRLRVAVSVHSLFTCIYDILRVLLRCMCT